MPVRLSRETKDFGSDLTEGVANAAGVHVEILALRLTGLEDVVAACIQVVLVVGDPGQPIGVKRLLAVVIVQTDHENDRINIGIRADRRGDVIGDVESGVTNRPRARGGRPAPVKVNKSEFVVRVVKKDRLRGLSSGGETVRGNR